MQPCESKDYVVDMGIVIGNGSDPKDPYKAATAAQKDAVKQLTQAAATAARNNGERCEANCTRQYHASWEPTPAFGPGPPYALQMAVYWTLYMDCKKRPAVQPAPPAPPPVKGKLKPPVPPKKGKISTVLSED
jgi:hypothetical protein